jgi:hypothetical protein
LSALGEVVSTFTDVIDALLCVLAASFFIQGRARLPVDLNTARQEGWI